MSFQNNHVLPKKSDFPPPSSSFLSYYDELLENALRNVSEMLYMGVVVQNNTVYCHEPKMKALDGVTKRHRTFIDMLTQTLQHHPMTMMTMMDLPIFFIQDDMNGCESYKPHDLYGIPHLAWSEPYNHHHLSPCKVISIPSYVHWRDAKEDWTSYFHKWNQKHPWSQKKQKAVWRGSSTGHAAVKYPNGTADFATLPRTQLVLMGNQRPDILNVAFHKLVGRFTGQETVYSHTLSQKIKFQDFMTYQAILDMDGYGWSSRFGHLLCTNSVILKIQPENVDYFFSSLQPWKEYIPIHANLSNLVSLVEYVLHKDNQQQMKRMVFAANQWCQQTLTKRQMMIDLHSKLSTYAQQHQQHHQQQQYPPTQYPTQNILHKYQLTKCHT